MYFDTHVHLNSDVYDNVEKVIKEAVDNGVKKMLVVGYDLETSKKAVKIASKFDFVYAAVGIHPSEVKKAKLSDLEGINALLNNSNVVAVGEIGLDYHWDKTNLEKQKIFFEKQIALSKKYNLPILIHSREAASDTYEVLCKNKCNFEKGIMHCYSYSVEMASKFIELGLLIAIGGVVTFQNAKEIKEVVKNIDIKNLVIETDAPYLTPYPYRGKINEPKYIDLIAVKIAELKDVDKRVIAIETYNNACTLFEVEK